jgi:hypothetical protein
MRYRVDLFGQDATGAGPAWRTIASDKDEYRAELHEMTKTHREGLPAWAVFRREKVEQDGHFGPERFELAVR